MAKKRKGSGVDVDALIANEQLINTDVTDEIEDAVLTYAIKTITDRALPDVRDGLKPVQRRILYTAWNNNFLPTGKFQKNARIVGDVMGTYHPHGDGSIYEALVNMSQPWNYRYPLVDFQGNNGSLDGDGAAAMRYTEGRLDKRAMLLLDDADKECVDFKPNYSETTEEPIVLPAMLPNLLLNGSSGIATGYTTDIPSHQLGEVIDGIIEVIKHPQSTVADIMKHIKGPDFTGGGYLVNNSKIRELYETGKSSLTVKGKCEVEQNEESGNNQIVITQIPVDVKKPKLVEQIHALCLEKKDIPRVIDVRDESKGNEIRVVVELHKTGIPEVVIRELYAKTALQKNSTYILRTIVNQTPHILNLKQIIEYYIEHRREVVDRRTKFVLSKAQARLHIQEGFKLVLGNIDKIIKIIKESEDDKEAREKLMANFGLSEIQANNVLDMKLRQLTKLNKTDIDKLIQELQLEIDKYKNIISSVAEIDKVVIVELKQLKDKYNDERRTILVDEDQAQQVVEASVTNSEPISLVLTSKNTVKQLTLKVLDDMFKNRSLKERTEAFVQGVKCTTSDNFVLVLNNGEYVKVEFSDISSGLTFLPEKALIKGIVVYNEKKAIVAMTKQGIIKKVKMDGFKARLRRVAPFLELQNKDEITCVRVSDLNDDNIITIATKDGLIHRFFEKSFKDTAAGGKGINGISLFDNNEIVGFDISNQNDDEKSKIVLFTEHNDGTNGIKSMPLTEFKAKGRIAQGIKGIEFGRKMEGFVKNFTICKEDFFVIDPKGNVVVYQYVSLPDYNRYNRPEIISEEVAITKFFLE